MNLVHRFLFLIVLAIPAVPRVAGASLSVTRVADGLDSPIFATAPPGDSSRLFIVEQHSGKIRILNLANLTLNATPFLTVGNLSSGSEQGLLGLAFHPNYATNGQLYVNFTDSNGTTRIVRYLVSSNPNLADAASAQTVLAIAQPQSNHNGGWTAFGPDGLLYIGTGDGGAADDQGSGHTEPGGNAQDITNNLLGKLLRIDVDGDDFPADATRNYAIPPNNPFVGLAGDDEIWAYGLRNPWRCSFDRLTGDLYMADVGQGEREEINVLPAGSTGGHNYGWRLREGTIETPGGVGGANPAGAIDPIYDYTHGGGSSEGYSVTGGYVYRGPISSLQGQYFFADFVNERVWSLTWDGSAPASFNGSNFANFIDWTNLLDPSQSQINNISSFAEDDAGNLYIIDLGGEVFRVNGPPDLGPTDPFFLYSLTQSSGAPAFHAFGPVSLADAFRTATYNVYRPMSLGLPANKNGEGVHDSATHLEEYKLVPTLQTPAFVRRDNVNVINECNSLLLSVTKPLSLLVPTAKDLVSPVPAPDPMAHELDHFLCYRAKAQTKLPKRMQVEVADQFQSRRYDLKQVTKLCVPTTKGGSPVYLDGPNAGIAKPIEAATIRNPEDHLLCYKAALARRLIAQSGCRPSNPSDAGTILEPSQQRHTPRLGLYLNNQFGENRANTKREVELCLPTARLSPP